MMILSRTWYVILGLFLAAAYYVVSLAVGQYNRRNEVAMEDTLRADSQVVSWAMQVDARKRLDTLILAVGQDAPLTKAVAQANPGAVGSKQENSAASRDEAVKALKLFNEKLPAEYRHDALLATDREGRLVAEVNYDQLNASPEFELGGYPAVNDALHGFLRDDTWLLGGKIARIVARPIEGEPGQAPYGALVGIKWVDNGFARDMGKRTRTTISFFALGQKTASAALENGGLEENVFDGALAADFAKVMDDKAFKETGRTDVRPLPDDKGGVIFVRMAGDAWELGAGFAVARPKVSIGNAYGFLQGADDQDKRNVKLWIVAALILGASAIGIFFSYLEHSMPMGELRKQGDRLRRGDIDQLQIARFRAGYRPIATDINAGIQRVIEKGGGTARKPADLESILGPVPAQPSMSAFSFPMADGSGAGPAPPSLGQSGAQPSLSQSQNRPFMQNQPPPPANAPRAGMPGLPAPASGGAARPGPPAFPGAAGGVFQGSERTMAMPGAPPPGAPPFAPQMPSNTAAHGGLPPPGHGQPAPPAAAAAAAAVQQLGTAGTVPAAFPTATQSSQKLPKEEEEQTMVAQPSADLIAASNDPAVEWQTVYQEFIRTKQQCGEPTDGLTFEKFQQTLKKNRDALMQRHGCKRVKFSVYVKEGRASLKATPVRE